MHIQRHRIKKGSKRAENYACLPFEWILEAYSKRKWHGFTGVSLEKYIVHRHLTLKIVLKSWCYAVILCSSEECFGAELE